MSLCWAGKGCRWQSSTISPIEASRGTPKSLFCLFPPAHCPISLPLGSPTCTGAQALGPCSNVFPRQIIRELNQKWSWVSNTCPFGMPGPETAALPTMPQAGPRFLKKKKSPDTINQVSIQISSSSGKKFDLKGCFYFTIIFLHNSLKQESEILSYFHFFLVLKWNCCLSLITLEYRIYENQTWNKVWLKYVLFTKKTRQTTHEDLGHT